MRGLVAGALMMAGGMGVAQSTGWPVGPGHTVMTLWPKGAPGKSASEAGAAKGDERDTSKATDELIAGRPVVRLGDVSIPTLTIFSPRGKNTWAAVLVLPGGGYSILAMDLEGTEVCDWLVSRGVTCALLKYRVPDAGPYPKHVAALEDAQRAMGLVRQHAAEWKVDPGRVGVLGFSAGGHLAAVLSTHVDQRVYPAVDEADTRSSRPDFTVLVYPAYLAREKSGGAGYELAPELTVTKETPPALLVQTEDDWAHVECSIEYFTALKKAGVPAEMHLFARGRHGYGLRRTELPVTEWPALVDGWLKTIGVVKEETRK